MGRVPVPSDGSGFGGYHDMYVGYHPDTGQALDSYAALLRLTGRRDEAVELEVRADKILKR